MVRKSLTSVKIQCYDTEIIWQTLFISLLCYFLLLKLSYLYDLYFKDIIYDLLQLIWSTNTIRNYLKHHNSITYLMCQVRVKYKYECAIHMVLLTQTSLKMKPPHLILQVPTWYVFILIQTPACYVSTKLQTHNLSTLSDIFRWVNLSEITELCLKLSPDTCHWDYRTLSQALTW